MLKICSQKYSSLENVLKNRDKLISALEVLSNQSVRNNSELVQNVFSL